MTIGTMLQNEATFRGMSHAEAGTAIGVSQATFSRWVLSASVPAPKYWAAIARYLHVPKTQVANQCAKERGQRGSRGVRQAVDDITALRRQIGQLSRAVDRIEEHLGIRH